MVREVGAAGTDNHVRTGFFRQRRQDFRIRVGHSEHDGFFVHGVQYFRRQQVRAGEAQEDVFAFDGIGKHALAVVFNGVELFGLVHTVFVFAGLVNHAFGVANGHVFAFQAQIQQLVQAGNRGRTCAGTHQSRFFDFTAGKTQGVQYGGGGNDGRAVLVVVEYGDFAAFA
ncbi:Uncharacterised protein [Neisseria meningitidis]|nr:Uncharacterised protein [Neisseria meningitidis]CWP98512.1 Uncharacterised protein [Neisseria meningitidis]CWS89597.1 Uncharacterised protein [Neisseria meningitidis]CWT90902.1 Uncharacterised protein [Neisseria meningitidis]